MLDPETRRKARELGVPGLADAIEMVEADASYAGLPFADKAKVVVDYAYQESRNRLVERLIKGARLRFPHADISNIVYEGRPLSRDLVCELGTAQFVANATDVIIEGFTGTGKSHLACAIAKQACKRGLRSLYVRMPDMLAYREEKMAAGWPEKKVLNKYVGYKGAVTKAPLEKRGPIRIPLLRFSPAGSADREEPEGLTPSPASLLPPPRFRQAPSRAFSGCGPS